MAALAADLGVGRTGERMTTSSGAVPRTGRGHLARSVRSLAAGAVITTVQLLVLYLSNDAIVLVLIGPALGWSVAAWALGVWRWTRVTHAWPIAFADLAWLFLAGGMHDALQGPRGASLLFGSLAVLSMGVGTACFFGRDVEGGIPDGQTASTGEQGQPPNDALQLTKPAQAMELRS
jgi:hypothetical protein